MINNTGFSQFIPPDQIARSAGTWTPTITSDVPSMVRTAGAGSCNFVVPVELPSNSAYRIGSQVKSIDIYWKNATADLTAFTVVVEKVTLSVSAITAPTGAALTLNTDYTINAEADTAAERYAQASFKMTITFVDPPWITNQQWFAVVLGVTFGATSTFTLYGARVNYTLRA